jgi:alpha-mannosidase
VFLQQYDKPAYRANAAIIFGTQAENTDLFPQQAELVAQWNSLYKFPHLQYAGVHEALAAIAAQFGDAIPIVRGDGGPYWEDGIASDAHYAAIERENETRGPSAEKLSTVASLIDPRIAPNTEDLNRMWRNMLMMDEHTWDSSDSVVNPGSQETREQLAVKDQYAVQAQQLSASLLRNSMANIANSISAESNSLVVFNTLNWKRSQLVAVDVENWLAQIVDPSTGQSVPVEVIGGGKDFRRIRFLAKNVPAVGYKVYQMRETAKPPEPAPSRQQTTLENSYYRVRLDPETGAIRSIYDNQLHRELVDQQSPYRFGQYLYVTGGDQAPNPLLQYSQVLPQPKLKIDSARDGKLISVTRAPWGWVARMESTNTNTPRIATEIRLFDQEKKIEVDESLEKTEVDKKEAAYFAFPFAMDQPKFKYEIQNGVVDPARDMLPGAGHEWFSVQHWVAVEQDGVAAALMPLDASLITLGDINRGAWPVEFGLRPASIFSYVMNNYWTTNYRAGQGGPFHFRYVMTTMQVIDDAQLSRSGWQEMTPLEINRITTQDKAQETARSLSSVEQSFLQIDDPDVVLTAWKVAEDGNGAILRFLDLGGAPRKVTVQAPFLRPKEAWEADAVERNQQHLSLVGTHGFQFTIRPRQIVTVRMTTR